MYRVLELYILFPSNGLKCNAAPTPPPPPPNPNPAPEIKEQMRSELTVLLESLCLCSPSGAHLQPTNHRAGLRYGLRPIGSLNVNLCSYKDSSHP
ncbi:unnamed protein product [Gadus morhua 'NCC']